MFKKYRFTLQTGVSSILDLSKKNKYNQAEKKVFKLKIFYKLTSHQQLYKHSQNKLEARDLFSPQGPKYFNLRLL